MRSGFRRDTSATGSKRLSILAGSLLLLLPWTTGLADDLLRKPGAAVADQSRPDGERTRPGKKVLSRLSTVSAFELESISASDRFTAPGRGLRDEHVLHERMSRSVQHSLERAGRDLLGDYLLEATRLDRRLGKSRDAGSVDNPAERKRTRFDVGISHMRPKVVMRYDLENAELKLSVGSRGNVGLRYRSQRLNSTELRFGFDGNDRFQLDGSFEF